MNWGQFKDILSLTGTMVASKYATQKMADLNPFTVMTIIFSH